MVTAESTVDPTGFVSRQENKIKRINADDPELDFTVKTKSD